MTADNRNTPPPRGFDGIISYVRQQDAATRFSKEVRLKETGQLGYVEKLQQLADHLGLARHNSLSGVHANIAEERQQAFAELYGFAGDNECMKALKLGDADKFRAAFDAHRNRMLDATEHAHTSAVAPRDTTKPLQQGPDRDIERSPVHGLGSIELTCGNTGHGETVIGVKITCGLAIIPVSRYPITLRSGELEIDCGKARATEDSVKGAAKETVGRFDATGTHGVVRCYWSGDFQRLRWIFDATGDSIGTLIFEPGALAKIVRIAPGDVIKATLGAYLKDIESDESAPSKTIDEFTIVDRMGERQEVPTEQLSILQRRIIEHLRKSVLRLNDEGLAVISTHELHLVERK